MFLDKILVLLQLLSSSIQYQINLIVNLRKVQLELTEFNATFIVKYTVLHLPIKLVNWEKLVDSY